MKRIIYILMAALLVTSLTACSSVEESPEIQTHQQEISNLSTHLSLYVLWQVCFYIYRIYDCSDTILYSFLLMSISFEALIYMLNKLLELVCYIRLFHKGIRLVVVYI